MYRPHRTEALALRIGARADQDRLPLDPREPKHLAPARFAFDDVSVP